MPTYDYECTGCGHTFEKLQSITAAPLRKCPECGARVRRLIGAGAGVIFKGSGFYETDYKRNRKPAACSTCDQAETCPKAKDGVGEKNGRKSSKKREE